MSIPTAILARIRKLAAMTEANGCSESEATQALQHMQRLIDQYQPTEAELRQEAARCERNTLTTMDSDHADWSYIAVAAAKLHGCRVWVQTAQEDLLGLGQFQTFYKIHFFGLPLDCGSAMSMTSLCFTAIQTEAMQWQSTQPKQRKAARTADFRSFRIGMADRLHATIKSFASKPQAPTGQGLVVLKNQLVNDEFAKLGLNLAKARRRTTTVNSHAFEAGQAAAAKVNLRSGSAVGVAPLAIGA